MVGAGETTELWRPPRLQFFIGVKIAIYNVILTGPDPVKNISTGLEHTDWLLIFFLQSEHTKPT